MKNKRIILLILITLFWFSLYAYVPQLSSYAEELGASYKLIGLISGIYGFSQTILRIPLGIISDKMRRRKLFVLLGIVSAVISSIIIYFITTPFSLLLGRFIAGIASATWVNFTVLYISYYDKEESYKAVGMANAACKLGQLISMFIGGFIAVKYGVRTILLFSIIGSLLSLILGAFIHESNFSDVEKNKSMGFSKVIANKTILYISGLAAILQLIVYGTTFTFTPIVATNLGADGLQLGHLVTIFNLPQVLFSILAGTTIVNRIGERKSLVIGFTLITIVCFITPFNKSLKILFLLQLISGVGNAIVFTLLMSMVMKGIDENLMTTVMGVYQAIFGIGIILGPIVLGIIGDILGLRLGFMLVSFLGMFAIYFTYNKFDKIG